MRGDNIRAWQTQMRKRGWDIVADGLYGLRSATVARAFQREHRLGVDGTVGPTTWRATWERPIL
jgi:peptidoglycan hydrolase-like protein with peptidoglycan-binding domain